MLPRPVQAVLLDVDGTLYHQEMLRLFMMLELAALPLVQESHLSATDVWSVLRTFRRVREGLRQVGSPLEPLAELQYTETARQMGIDPNAVERVIAEWMYQRPLKYLKLCRRRGLEAFFMFLKNNDVRIGLFSDYPVREKISALGLSESIRLALCATDPEINAFKPHPQGFLRACAVWGLPPEEILYIGDRPEIDAVGAAMAGMSCAILSRKASTRGQYEFSNCFAISSFPELQHALIDNVKR
jgi:HAD superfamily hydrolase (TIGR01549 family)